MVAKRRRIGRQKKLRYCQGFSGYNLFKPSGIPLAQVEIVEVALYEIEAMRLCDLKEIDQARAAEKMEIPRGTVQRLVSSGRSR